MSELSAEIDALFRLPPGEFTAARNSLAKRTGRKDVKAFKKPTLAAWAVNQLALRHAAKFSEIRSAHEGAAAATSSSPDELRAAVTARRNALHEGFVLARSELEQAELGCTAATSEKIRSTIEALVADRTLAVGRLSKELQCPGFAVLAPAAPDESLETPRSVIRQRAQAELRAREEAAEVATERAAQAKSGASRAEAEVGRLEERLKAARARAAESNAAAERATRRAGETAVALAEARRRLADIDLQR